MMVCLLLYAYGVGGFSRRKLALACERPLALLAMVGQERPDFRTLSDFRTLHLAAFQDVLIHVGRLAGELGLGRLGNVATDGTQMQGTASRHKAMRSGSRQKAGARLREARAALGTPAYQQDAAEEAALGSRRGDERPAEWARRAERLGQMEAAMRRWEAQAKAEAQVERQRRAAAEAERERTGTPRRGHAPQAVVETPDAKAQRNFTDPEWHSRRTHNTGWDSGGNAPASVDAPGQMIVACDVTAASNDQQQAEPRAQATRATLAQAGMERPQGEAGEAHAIPTTLDSGDYREAAVEALERGGCDPYSAPARQRHHTPQAEASAPPATAQERMAAKGRTPAGRAVYARRQVIGAPGFGQIKEVRGFRRFLLRGLANIRGEWRLVCLTPNLLKLWRYGCAPRTGSYEEGPRAGGCDGPWEGV
jgi:Transposase DDE domain